MNEWPEKNDASPVESTGEVKQTKESSQEERKEKIVKAYEEVIKEVLAQFRNPEFKKRAIQNGRMALHIPDLQMEKGKIDSSWVYETKDDIAKIITNPEECEYEDFITSEDIESLIKRGKAKFDELPMSELFSQMDFMELYDDIVDAKYKDDRETKWRLIYAQYPQLIT
ncbi:MAG: hypothetical protein WA055_01050 [Candidatus Moraniibacteriota bacterium]